MKNHMRQFFNREFTPAKAGRKVKMKKNTVIIAGGAALVLALIMAGMFVIRHYGREDRQADTVQDLSAGNMEATGRQSDLPEEDNSETGTQALEEEGSQQEQTEYIGAVPDEYMAEAGQQGRVIQVAYETRDYTLDSEELIQKPTWVYLPYGYDENDADTRYDILYLMHGWGMTADNYFNGNMSQIVNILDNMIEKGDIPPIIAVSATFDAQNSPQSFSRSVDEIAAFHNDFRNDLAPYMESHFHTWAEGTGEADFEASREHRAFAGFSLGAVTTWYQFVYNLDYVKYFLPMSGDCWILGTYGGRDKPVETTEYLEKEVQDGGWKEDDFYIYSAIGTSDPIWEQVNNQMQEMIPSDVFTPDNLHYAIREGGRHDMDACEEYLYHALPVFFGKD